MNNRNNRKRFLTPHLYPALCAGCQSEGTFFWALSIASVCLSLKCAVLSGHVRTGSSCEMRSGLQQRLKTDIITTPENVLKHDPVELHRNHEPNDWRKKTI